MWMISGISAGLLLGFYDFWTKKAMIGNTVIPVVFWSSLFGFLLWIPAFIPVWSSGILPEDLLRTDIHQQTLIFVRSLSMTLSWVLAFFAMRELPMSFTGAVRASGPIWTLIGGAILLQEYLSVLQISFVLVSVLAYYVLSQVGKSEGISVFRSKPMLVMTFATLLSSLTTVYDKYIIHDLGLSIYSVQAYSSLFRLVISVAFLCLAITLKRDISVQWSPWIPLVGLSWVIAEYIYFFAVESADANSTYLSVFRRMSLIVGFILSVFYFKERNILLKSLVVGSIILSTIALIFGYK